MLEVPEDNRVDELLARVEALEKKVAELEAQVQAQPTEDAIVAKIPSLLVAKVRGSGLIG